MHRCIGVPDESEWPSSCISFRSSFRQNPSKSLEHLVPQADPEALSLLRVLNQNHQFYLFHFLLYILLHIYVYFHFIYIFYNYRILSNQCICKAPFSYVSVDFYFSFIVFFNFFFLIIFFKIRIRTIPVLISFIRLFS